ncbi:MULTISPECIES: hypothetical protein [Halobacterium]|uniref:hypothetical protein n=1 Tax=Halobacterium TaxID=2239 RepID=UPI00073F06AC|nr:MULTISPECIES: hypothetical protein [Halobacterium]MCG1004876.1 hypothetical protein [Halobacterium noricense]
MAASATNVQVSSHAEQRFLERVNPTEPYPRTRIEREFREAQRAEIDDHDISESARLHPDSRVVYVYDEGNGTVVTCFPVGDDQLGERIEVDL